MRLLLRSCGAWLTLGCLPVTNMFAVFTHTSQGLARRFARHVAVLRTPSMQRIKWPRGSLLPWPTVGMSSVLLSRGFGGGPGRLSVVANFLLQFEFEYLEDLVGSHLDELPAFESLHVDDQSFLLDLVAVLTREGMASRHVARVVKRSAPAPPIALPSNSQRLDMFAANASQPVPVPDIAGDGPSAALKKLKWGANQQVAREAWVRDARMAAILGSCPRSHKSALSGLRCYMKFCEKVLHLGGREFPPSVESLLAWSALFRCSRTFSNYLNYVRLGCDILGSSSAALDDKRLNRAKCAIEKRRLFVPRSRMFIRSSTLRDMFGLLPGDPSLKTALMMFLTCYCFLLRLPSECLPITKAGVGIRDGEQAVLEVHETSISLKLDRRKNRLHGSHLYRSCWCNQCKVTCPLHVLGPWYQALPPGAKPFASFSAARALEVLRALLVAVKVPNAERHRTHDLRRGHARDLQASGAPLLDILKAGEWRSPAFLTYLDLEQLEHDAVVEAHLAESSDDE